MNRTGSSRDYNVSAGSTQIVGFVVRQRLIRQRATLLLPCVISRAAR
jgi:hypothetical protein